MNALKAERTVITMMVASLVLVMLTKLHAIQLISVLRVLTLRLTADQYHADPGTLPGRNYCR